MILLLINQKGESEMSTRRTDTVQKSETVAIVLIISFVVLLVGAFFSLPSYADYCKEPQAHCEMNKEHSVLNIFKTLKEGPN